MGNRYDLVWGSMSGSLSLKKRQTWRPDWNLSSKECFEEVAMNMKERVEELEEETKAMREEPPWLLVCYDGDRKASKSETEAMKVVHRAQNPDWAKRPFNVIYT